MTTTDIQQEITALTDRRDRLARDATAAQRQAQAAQTALVEGTGTPDEVAAAVANHAPLAAAVVTLDSQIAGAQARLAAAQQQERRTQQLSELLTITTEGQRAWSEFLQAVELVDTTVQACLSHALAALADMEGKSDEYKRALAAYIGCEPYEVYSPFPKDEVEDARNALIGSLRRWSWPPVKKARPAGR